MIFIIDPDTGKSLFEIDDIEFLTTLEEPEEGVFEFRVYLKDGRKVPFRFNRRTAAEKLFHEIYRQLL